MNVYAKSKTYVFISGIMTMLPWIYKDISTRQLQNIVTNKILFSRHLNVLKLDSRHAKTILTNFDLKC